MTDETRQSPAKTVSHKRALYFGCREANVPGHYLHEGRKTIWHTPPEIQFWDRLIDSGLLKNGQRPDVYNGKVFWTCGGRPDLWYAFYWWDNSGDRRPGSNSGFYVGGFEPQIFRPQQPSPVWPAVRNSEGKQYGMLRDPMLLP